LRVKIDENLPLECAGIFLEAGFESETVEEEGLRGADDSRIAFRVRAEDRVLVTLDLGFGNIGAYPPADYAGIIVLRLRRQDKHTVLSMIKKIALVLANRAPAKELWIVEADRIRFRSG